jgi:hypothetical protein
VGLLGTLITLPLAPVRGVVWVVEQVADEADRQMFDETRIRGELLQLELDYDEGLVDDEERAAIEDELIARLTIARQRKREEAEHAAASSDLPGEEGRDG